MTTTALNGENPSMVERVLSITRERIVSGVYPPGSRLRLQMLAEESGASLIPVREALRVLEAERLVESIPNRGARVASLSLDDMQDLYSVRILLETESVRHAQPLEPEEEAELTALLDEMKTASASDDVERVLELHRTYHFALYGRTHSSWLPYLIDLLWKHTERYQRLSLAFRDDAADHEHRAVLEALARGDSDRAASALRSHLETTARLVIEAYQAPEGEMATS
jgi:DNA-binding GntR family transcriptional regulator